jgi:hypothetical protein
LVFQHFGKPNFVIFPHILEGDIRLPKPLWPHFLTLHHLALEIVGLEKMYKPLLAKNVKNQKRQEAAVDGTDVGFFDQFSQGAGGDGLRGLEFPSETVVFVSSQTTFFVAQQDFLVFVDYV